MPTALHEVLVRLFQRRPELLLEFAMQAGVELPLAETVEELSADLSSLVSTELRADLVFQLRDPAGITNTAVVVEV